MAGRSSDIPIFSATRREAAFASSIIETIRVRPRTSKAWSRQAAAASVAIPRPQRAWRVTPPSATSGLAARAPADRAPAEAIGAVALAIAFDPRAGLVVG